VLAGSPLAALAPARELALAGVTFYLGANLVTHLGQGTEAVAELLASAERLAATLSWVGGGQAGGGGCGGPVAGGAVAGGGAGASERRLAVARAPVNGGFEGRQGERLRFGERPG
jgi:hypothetical protein